MERVDYHYSEGPFSVLYKTARTGSVITLCPNKHGNDIMPHSKGILRILTEQMETKISINDGMLEPASPADEYISYYDDWVMRRGESFYYRNNPAKPFYVHKGKVEKCLPTQRGTFLVVDAAEGRIVEVYDSRFGIKYVYSPHHKTLHRKPFDEVKAYDNVPIVRKNNGFSYVGEKQPFFNYGHNWNDEDKWWPYSSRQGTTIAIYRHSEKAVFIGGDPKMQALLFEGDLSQSSVDIFVVNGNLVGRTGETFSVNGTFLKERYRCKSCQESWHGVLLFDEEYVRLLVVKRSPG